jgi:hypothetical protein
MSQELVGSSRSIISTCDVDYSRVATDILLSWDSSRKRRDRGDRLFCSEEGKLVGAWCPMRLSEIRNCFSERI